jgi:hypothetical protein
MLNCYMCLTFKKSLIEETTGTVLQGKVIDVFV